MAFRVAARELNAILSGAEDNAAAEVLGDLDEGCDLLMFYGLTVTERIEVEDGMEIHSIPRSPAIRESGTGGRTRSVRRWLP